MFFSLILAVVAIAATHAASLPRAAESHHVELINNCGSGRAVFFHQADTTLQGSTTIHGPLNGGIAWIDGFAHANCLMSGVNCGIVEFTLKNHDGQGWQNAADYSLLDGLDRIKGDSLGNHRFTYPMDFEFTGASTGGPGPCVGDSAEACPGAFLDSATEGGVVFQSLADDVGVR